MGFRKTGFHFFLLIPFLALPAFDGLPAQETGSLVVEPLELDFGKVLDGDEPVKKVNITNRGSVPLKVIRISTTCGCAVPRVVFPGNKEVLIGSRPSMGYVGILEPGQEANMDVMFTTHGYTGKLKKKISIETDDAQSTTRYVDVLAEIVESVAFTPEYIEFGEVVRGQRIRRKAVVKSVGIGDFEVTGVRNLPGYLKFIKAEKLSSGENAEVALEIETGADPPMGETKYELKFELENAYVDVAKVWVKMNVIPKVGFRLAGSRLDDEIDFGVFTSGQGKTLTVDIVNLAPSIPYLPLDVDVEKGPFESFIEQRLEQVEPGTHYRLNLRIKPGMTAPGFLRGKVNILSDHPDILRKTFYLSGWVSAADG